MSILLVILPMTDAFAIYNIALVIDLSSWPFFFDRIKLEEKYSNNIKLKYSANY